MRRMRRALTVIGVPCSAGAHHAGLERGPAALRAAGLLDRLRGSGCEVADAGDLAPRVFTSDAAHPRARNRDAVVAACRDVADATGQAVAAGRVPVLVGGDCSITAGAVVGCLSQRPDTGLLYLDGDADLRTPQTTIAGNFDGMVIAGLLGEGDPGYTGLAGAVPMLPPSRLAILGYDRRRQFGRPAASELSAPRQRSNPGHSRDSPARAVRQPGIRRAGTDRGEPHPRPRRRAAQPLHRRCRRSPRRTGAQPLTEHGRRVGRAQPDGLMPGRVASPHGDQL